MNRAVGQNTRLRVDITENEDAPMGRPVPDRARRRPRLAWLAFAAPLAVGVILAQLDARSAQAAQIPTNGRGLYEIGCALCHGVDGRGVDLDKVAFDAPLPDFADCSSTEREPDADWLAVARAGGHTRGFDRSMPAFGEGLSIQQMQQILDHIRTLCADKRWPRGELNLPRALVTEKAYPEDEFVYTVGVNIDGDGGVHNEALYENRFGARSMFEIKVPFGARELTSEDGWGNVAIGDVAIAVKHTLSHSIESGSILSVGAEVILPTGSPEQGVGKGTLLFEPFVAYGRILPGDLFFQFHGGLEVSANRAKVQHEAFWRAAFGGSWRRGGVGRTWTPMLEVLGAIELEDGARVEWMLVPQLQVSLNRKQHVLLNLGVGIPATDSRSRSTQFLVYLLWDWHDGGFLAGW